MNLTSKPDFGIWIAAAGALAVIGAVVAGFLAVGSPEDARAQRLDEARLVAMQQVATAAQCAFTFTNRVPASVDEVRSSIFNQRIVTAGYNCGQLPFALPEDRSVSYAAEGEDHIELCANFNRPTSPSSGNLSNSPYMLAEFPELREPRTVAGGHCYRIRLVKQVLQNSQ